MLEILVTLHQQFRNGCNDFFQFISSDDKNITSKNVTSSH